MTKTKSYKTNRALRECTVVVGNWAKEETASEIYAVFSTIGECTVSDRQVGTRNAEVQFKSRDLARKAVDFLAKTTIRKRPITVRPKPAASQNAGTEVLRQDPPIPIVVPPPVGVPTTTATTERSMQNNSTVKVQCVDVETIEEFKRTLNNQIKRLRSRLDGLESHTVEAKTTLRELEASLCCAGNTSEPYIGAAGTVDQSQVVSSVEGSDVSADTASVVSGASTKKRKRGGKKAGSSVSTAAHEDPDASVAVPQSRVVTFVAPVTTPRASRPAASTPASAQAVRNYCTIEVVASIAPIAGNNSLELATVQGWNVAVYKGAFAAGDGCVFVPIDTLVDRTKPHFKNLPGWPAPTKLASAATKGKAAGSSTTGVSSQHGPQWGKVESLEVAPQVYSQGIALPVSSLPVDVAKAVLHLSSTVKYAPTAAAGTNAEYVQRRLDSLMGVKKYTKEVRSENVLRVIKGLPEFKQGVEFPTDIIPKSDEHHLRAHPRCLDEIHAAMRGAGVYISKKMDGQSMTLILTEAGKFMVCSRHKVCDVGSVWYQYAKEHGLEARIRSLGFGVALQCELCGPKINENKMRLEGYEIFVFTAKKLVTPDVTAQVGAVPISGGDDAMIVDNDEAEEAEEDGDDDDDQDGGGDGEHRRRIRTSEVDAENGEDDSQKEASDDRESNPLDRMQGTYCGLDELRALCAELGVQMAPVLKVVRYDASTTATTVAKDWSVQAFQNYADTITYEDPITGEHFPAEGIVIRPVTPAWSPALKGVLSVKMIHSRYRD